MIVFDASALVGAALKADSVPERALLRAEEVDVFALSPEVEVEIVEVLGRPKLTQSIRRERREHILAIPAQRGCLVRACGARRRLP